MSIDEWNTQFNTLEALEIAKYVLARIVDIQSVERLAEEFDNDVQFINGIIKFLKEVRWIEQDCTSGLYQLTANGKTKVNSSTSKLIVWI